jgi:general nucleoside transport system permease protein
VSFDFDLLFVSIGTAILAATPVLIAATGELLEERVGVYNIGIEGTMLFGALVGLIATNATGNLILGLLAAIAVGALISLIFGVGVIYLQADMVVAGLAMTFLGIGFTGVFGVDFIRDPAEATIPQWNIPLLHDIPYLGDAFFDHLSLTYIAFLMPFGAWFLLFRTRHGLNMRAIGENPAAADVSGINVNGWRMFYVAVGGAFAGLGGAFLSLGTIETWLSGMTAGLGWIALAIVIFANWQPIRLIAGALLFGGLGTLGNVAQALGWNVPSEVFSALPYLGTILVLVALAAVRSRRAERPPWPAALGAPFTRGES